MKKLVPVVAGIMVAGVVVGAIVGVGRLPAGSEDTAGSGGELRWLDVTLQLPPEDSPLYVTRLLPFGPDKPRFIIQIYVDREVTPGVEPSPQSLEIDAETGEVVSDTLSATLSDQAISSQLQAILDSVGIASGPPEVWPYVDISAPSPSPGKWGNLTFAVPEPASGITVSPTSGLCSAAPPDCVPKWLTVRNGRSHMGINADTGELMGLDGVLLEDREAFERYAASVQLAAATREP